MPLHKKIKINKGEFVLIWHISETKQELLDTLKQDSSFHSKLNSIKSEVKQIEFLSVLNLLEKQNLSFEDIHYDLNGKPSLKDRFISITHSFNYSGIFISNNKAGIDIEKFRNQILNISMKFISNQEHDIFDIKSVESLTKAWTIKESVFKAFGHSGIDFKKNIKIQSLKNDKAFVVINKNEILEQYSVDLFTISNYICSLAKIIQ